MKKSEIFSLIVDEVCDECEVQRDALINGVRLQSVVDARILAVQAMRRVGLTNEDIALCVHRERIGDKGAGLELAELKSRARGIQKNFTAYTSRCEQSRVFCGHSVDVMWFIHEKFGVTFYGQPPAGKQGTISE